ncbi:MAG: PorV/PorQ family protein [Ignavibacteriae bacterium]|nr:PorV/PorQ family protein [Ignavibacteriota bacterium]
MKLVSNAATASRVRGMSLLVLLVAAAALLPGVSSFAGGGNRRGTAAADQLLVPVGARGIALGGAPLSGISGTEAIYYNPAGLAGMSTSVDVRFSHMSGFDADGLNYAAVGASFAGFGHVGLSIKSFSFGDIVYTDERNPDGTGAVFAPTFVDLGITYARALTDRIRAGLTAHIVSEELNRVSSSGIAFDIGVQYHGLANVRGLQLGVALKHLGSAMAFDGPGLYRTVNEIGSDREGQLLKIEAAGFQMPTSIEIGMGYVRDLAPEHVLTVSSSFENNNFLPDQYRMAVEYGYMNLFFARVSYTLAGGDAADVNGESSYLFGPSFGAGVRQNAGSIAFEFDYAYRTAKVFKGSHAFTLGITF